MALNKQQEDEVSQLCNSLSTTRRRRSESKSIIQHSALHSTTTTRRRLRSESKSIIQHPALHSTTRRQEVRVSQLFNTLLFTQQQQEEEQKQEVRVSQLFNTLLFTQQQEEEQEVRVSQLFNTLHGRRRVAMKSIIIVTLLLLLCCGQEVFSSLPTVFIIISVKTSKNIVKKCVSSLIRHQPSDLKQHVVFVDDGSPQDTIIFEKQLCDNQSMFTCLKSRPRGYTHAINMGIEKALKISKESNDAIVLLNSDVIVTRGWLMRMYDALVFDNVTALVGPVSNAGMW